MPTTDPTDVTLARASLRAEALAKRNALDPTAREVMGSEVIQNLRTHLEQIRATYLHCYISFRTEVDTRGFIEEVLERGLRIVVPVVEELDGRQFLIHTEIKGLQDLRQGAFGLEEPVERTPASLEDLDAVIIPLSAFDRTGARMGYGKGFYDRFLAELPEQVERIGLAYSVQEFASIPVLPHDETLDLVITERETIHCHR